MASQITRNKWFNWGWKSAGGTPYAVIQTKKATTKTTKTSTPTKGTA